MMILIKRILAMSEDYKGRIQLAFVFSFLKSFLAKVPVGLAVIMLWAFLEERADERLCLWIGIAMAASLMLQILCQHTADRLQSAAGFLMFAKKRMNLGSHLRKMPMGYFTEGNIGKISSVLSTDMVFIEENCMTVLADMMSYIFAEGVMVAFLLIFSPWLGVAAVFMIGCILLIAKGMKAEALADSADRQEQSENLTEAVLDFTEGIGIIKTYNLLGDKSKELTENFHKSCKTSIRFEENHGPWQYRLNLAYGLGAALIVGGAMVLYREGMLEASLTVGIMLFVFDLFGPLKALYGQIGRLTVMNSCIDRIEEVFAECELPDEGTKHIPAQGDEDEIRFSNVNFAYKTDSGKEKEDSETQILHDISFCVKKNQMAALAGPSGGGKSTIASLLARFWDVKSGQILIRGMDIRDIPLSELMNHISMVFQRVYLFQDTIYNNIIMGRPDAARWEVMEAAKKARCYDFIMALPEGFETMVGEGGETLSGGEKQRISIARCILKDAPVVILDEATASVDADNESYIQEAISELVKGKTLLVIAHRLNTIRSADQILVVDHGRISQRGTHQELMAQPGMYRDFVTIRKESSGWSLN